MANPKPGPLSARQTEIAEMVGKGKSSREIGGILGLSPRTVDAHVTAIFQKLGVHSRLELAAALRRPEPSERARPAVPPLRSVDANSNNVPSKLTSFVGREAQGLGLTLAADSKHLLLVFDNCEHLVTDVARVVALILDDCHTVKIVESRRSASGRDVPHAVARRRRQQPA